MNDIVVINNQVAVTRDSMMTLSYVPAAPNGNYGATLFLATPQRRESRASTSRSLHRCHRLLTRRRSSHTVLSTAYKHRGCTRFLLTFSLR